MQYRAEQLHPDQADRDRPVFRDQVRQLLPAAALLPARRLRDLLRAALRAGTFDSGRLPGEAELMADHHVPRDVVRAALGLLREDGLIERRRGVGTVPIRDHYVVPGALPPPGRTLEEHLELGRIAPRLLHWAWIPAPRVIATHLDGVQPDEDCLCIEYVLLLDDRPVAVFTNYLRAPEASRVDQAAFGDDFYTLLRGGHVELDGCDVGVQAARADDTTAALLHILPGEPVLLVEQTIRTRGGEAVDYALGSCRAEIQLELGTIPRLDMTATLPHRR
ncbi:putative transcriptional regulator, GntR family [Nocardia nova SH22a]|uniref:Putative transcriptional regulator, GntR family n=1 Tax=Nocardia nova SH22a TaxID=1415166 RepID=W5TQB7_9NOCA|nr:GntR family transcriptional regulator [Nocardia nova]AHH19416.1 putative transcriptional regulator, GntR family [Nocardia nova SH22a]